MLRLRLKFLLQNKQTRLILLLTLCLSLLITAIGLFSYSRYRQELDSELNTPNIELLQINLDVTNRAFRESDNKAVDASFQPDVLEYIRQGANADPALVSRVQQYLHTVSAGRDIQSIDIIRFDDHSLISSTAGYHTWQNAPDRTWTGWIEHIHNKPLLIERRWQGTDREQGETELLSLSRPVRTGNQVTGAVLVNLDYDRFFSNFYIHLSSSQYVYDLDGRLIYPKLDRSVPAAGMQKVLDELGVQPYAYVQLNGQSYMANQTFSDVTGWRLVSLVPTEQLLKNVKLARNMMLLLSLISILIGCAAIYSYSYAAFRPLRRINRLLHPEDPDSRQSLYDLEPVIGKLVGDFHSKALVAERSLPELRIKYVQDVLHRSIGPQEMNSKWEQYFQDWQPGPLLILIISIDRYDTWAASYSESDRMLLKYALHNMMAEILEPHWRTAGITGEQDRLIWMVQPRLAQDHDERRIQLHQDLQRMMTIASEHLRLSLSAGVGSEMMHISEAPLSYQQADTALSRRLYQGYGQILEYDHASSPESAASQNDPPLPDDHWRRELLQCVEQGDADTALIWLRRWCTAAREQESSPSTIRLLIHRSLEQLVEMAAQQHLSLPPEMANYHQHLLSTMNLDDIEELITRTLIHLTGQMDIRRDSREHLLVERIKQYMLEHLSDNIGLPDVAEYVQLSVSSVSMLFKEQTGSTIYDYLTRLRLDRACELLRHSNLKIADIAAQVGYQNENSFIRTFRKHKSITPGKYREQG
ncbi:AraC family transcriptional regulator [Paenibacillus bovis]|uniref:AraC family transcriptional regulator n=2 Tax=Paenibacillus bovis TaxID=1616788 RepID=A0A172ZB13_9BACL|nr:AraC family transcriptional regulator [Paenibacillus bovis]